MLFKTLGYITSIGNLAIIYGLTSNGKITDFWSEYWLIGMGSILFLSLISTSLFYLNNKNEGINVLKFYGGIYGILALLIYGYWGIKNLINPVSFSEFQGNFVLFSVLSAISFFSIRSYMKEYNSTKLLFTISSILSVMTIVVTFATIYKYIFLQAAFDFDQLFFEMFVIGLGSIMFIGSHTYAVKNA